MKKGLSIVIPNYNGVQLFIHTLPTVFKALEQVSIPSEVIIADDCSTDSSLIYLQKEYPQIKVILNATNSGFSVTANNGINAAAYSYVLLLNSDVKLEPDYFLNLFSYFEDPTTFGVVGRIVGWEDAIIQDGAKYPSFHGVKIKTSGNYLLENEAAMQFGLFSMYLSGACALLDKEKFQKCGGFNELFSPFYVEDYELSLRAWRLGWKCYYDHRAVCRHKVSTSIKSKNKKKYVETIYNRNKMFLHAIHLSPQKRLVWFLQLGAETLARFFTLRWSYLRSLYLFISSYKKVRDYRIKLQRLNGNVSLLSIDQVSAFILNSIQGKKIRRF
jgi:GT2 family glycosyltransferase